MSSDAQSGPSPTKLSAKRAAPRERLLMAARELMAAGGLHNLSLDAIAARAGVTKGAIYDNYESKDALIVAAMASGSPQSFELFEWPKGRRGSVKSRLRRLGNAVLAGPAMNPGVAIARAEFVLYAMTHPDLRARLSELSTLGPSHWEANVLELFAPEELPMPPRAFAWMLTSLISGLINNRVLAPYPPDDATVLAIFEGLSP
jgi:AcrR family transcriptional regulator